MIVKEFIEKFTFTKIHKLCVSLQNQNLQREKKSLEENLEKVLTAIFSRKDLNYKPLEQVKFVKTEGINAYDLVNHEWLFVSKDSIDQINKQFA